MQLIKTSGCPKQNYFDMVYDKNDEKFDRNIHLSYKTQDEGKLQEEK